MPIIEQGCNMLTIYPAGRAKIRAPIFECRLTIQILFNNMP